MVYARILPGILRKKACEGKQAYGTRTAAKEVLKKLIRKHNATGMHAYRCPHCNAFHLGHPPKVFSGPGVLTGAC